MNAHITSERIHDAVIVGGGLAGLSAAVYLGRAQRDALIVDSGRSLANWEPNVQNYLGFPDGISGEELLRRGRLQARNYGVDLCEDEIIDATRADGLFYLRGTGGSYQSRRLLLATGLFHLAPDIPGLDACMGHSFFFCKDCDAYRVQGQQIGIIGRNNEAVEYALGMLPYSAKVFLATNGKNPVWDQAHANWVREYEIPILTGRILQADQEHGKITSLTFESGECLSLNCAFTTRGDIFHNRLAKSLGAKIDSEGQILVNEDGRTSVPGLYAAGCVTPANCQMIIAAGEGAAAAQAINRDLFEESLRNHSLRCFRERQLRSQNTGPELIREAPPKTA
jgi:thioredoxin reductase (NADPH)